MATKKQRQVVEVLTGPNSQNLTQAEIVRRAGYSESMVDQSTRVVKSAGVQKLLDEMQNVGLTDEYLMKKIKVIAESNDFKSAINAIRLVLQARYAELRPSFRVDVNSQSLVIDVEEVRNQAFSVIALEYGLSVDKMKEVLEKAATTS